MTILGGKLHENQALILMYSPSIYTGKVRGDRHGKAEMSKKDTAQFWESASDYLNHHLKVIRQVSNNTIESCRDSLNNYIDYLESVKRINRKKVTFHDFEKDALKNYQDWMITTQKLPPKTCNLRMTAIRAFLEFAAQENLWLMPIYTDACSIRNAKTENHPIEYFEPDEMKALLAAPSDASKTDRRNRMMLIFLYDTAARVSEVKHVKLEDLHLEAKVPYVTLLGKGRKFRNIPLMERTIQHLKRYIKEFPGTDKKSEKPLFCSRVHGQIHELSLDTFEKMIKKYAEQCKANGEAMPVNVHCHLIRKTRAMDLYREGVPLTHI